MLTRYRVQRVACEEMTYCEYVAANPDSIHAGYHDEEYGFPLTDETLLFERLMLEVNQAGLSWELILKRKEGLRLAYSGWSVDTVAAYGESDVVRLLADARIIRNRLKVQAAIHNAGVVLNMRSEGGFSAWLDRNHPLTREEWTKLFRKTFRFTGGEIVNEFLMSTGYLPGAHEGTCPVYARVLTATPAWAR